MATNPGFFKRGEIKEKTPTRRKGVSCEACGLYKTCLSPKMEPTGDGGKGFLFVAEAPGETEDKRGEQLIGKSGKLLRSYLRQNGIDLDQDGRKINAINCRPPDNRDPTSKEIDCCRPRVWAEIESFRPKAIFLMGAASVQSFLGHRWPRGLGDEKKGGKAGIMSKWRGWTIPDRDVHAWVLPIFHPSYVARSEDKQPVVATVFKQDLAKAVECALRPFPTFTKEESRIQVILNADETYAKLREFHRSSIPLFAFDYETTGLKPYNRGHRIFCASISYGEGDGETFSFLLQDERIKQMLARILKDPSKGKIAQSLKFEDTWTNVCLGVPVTNWVWDTMLATHFLDNRPNITGLKFQAYVRYGLLDYSSHLDVFLKAPDDDGANGFNRVHEAPLLDLLIYCGTDSLLEFRMAKEQMEYFGRFPWDMVSG